jgi:hypothetical protein
MWIARVNLIVLMNTSTINEHLNLNKLKAPDTIEITLMYHINDNGKYIFDDEEMHAALDEKVNEISLTLNNRHNLN